MSGLFEGLGDVDWNAVEDDPWAVAPGKFRALVSDFKTGPTKDGSKIGASFFYELSEGPNSGQTVMEWKRVPDNSMDKDEKARALSFLKERLLSLDVPENRMNVVTKEDLVGREVLVTIKEGKEGRPNVTKVEPASAAAPSTGLGSFTG